MVYHSPLSSYQQEGSKSGAGLPCPCLTTMLPHCCPALAPLRPCALAPLRQGGKRRGGLPRSCLLPLLPCPIDGEEAGQCCPILPRPCLLPCPCGQEAGQNCKQLPRLAAPPCCAPPRANHPGKSAPPCLLPLPLLPLWAIGSRAGQARGKQGAGRGSLVCCPALVCGVGLYGRALPHSAEFRIHPVDNNAAPYYGLDRKGKQSCQTGKGSAEHGIQSASYGMPDGALSGLIAVSA